MLTKLVRVEETGVAQPIRNEDKIIKMTNRETTFRPPLQL